MAHKYEVVVSDGRSDRILRNTIEGESKRHVLSLAKTHCRDGEEPVRALKKS